MPEEWEEGASLSLDAGGEEAVYSLANTTGGGSVSWVPLASEAAAAAAAGGWLMAASRRTHEQRVRLSPTRSPSSFPPPTAP